jgi:hypothetical protein
MAHRAVLLPNSIASVFLPGDIATLGTLFVAIEGLVNPYFWLEESFGIRLWLDCETLQSDHNNCQFVSPDDLNTLQIVSTSEGDVCRTLHDFDHTQDLAQALRQQNSLSFAICYGAEDT